MSWQLPASIRSKATSLATIRAAMLAGITAPTSFIVDSPEVREQVERVVIDTPGMLYSVKLTPPWIVVISPIGTRYIDAFLSVVKGSIQQYGTLRFLAGDAQALGWSRAEYSFVFDHLQQALISFEAHQQRIAAWHQNQEHHQRPGRRLKR